MGESSMRNRQNIVINIIESDIDVDASRHIREVVFVVEQEVPPEIEYDEFEESSTHILARIDGEAVGTARWRQTDQGQKLERFAVLKSARGQGVGEALVNFILEQIEDKHTSYLNSQVVAIDFYKRCGFEAIGGIFYEADIPHRKMIYKAT